MIFNLPFILLLMSTLLECIFSASDDFSGTLDVVLSENSETMTFELSTFSGTNVTLFELSSSEGSFSANSGAGGGISKSSTSVL